jgi:hypothetical protein
MLGVDDGGRRIQRGVGIGVVLTFEGDADHVVFVVDETRHDASGATKLGFSIAAMPLVGVHREAVGEQRQDGRQPDQPPSPPRRPAITVASRASVAMSERAMNGHWRLAGEQDEVQAVGVLGPRRVRPYPTTPARSRRRPAQ